jgi:ankyrin repeat protein
MKKLFQSINKRDFLAVKNLIEKKPELVNCKSIGYIKRDEGQTPLRVAIKNSCYEMVELMINNGADINFYTKEDNMSIIHQAVYTALRRSIPSCLYEGTFEDALKIFNLLIDKNVDLSIVDKIGWNCFQLGLGVARGRIYSNLIDSDLPDDIEWCNKIKSIFLRLIEKGVDISLNSSWENMAVYKKWRLNVLSLCGIDKDTETNGK